MKTRLSFSVLYFISSIGLVMNCGRGVADRPAWEGKKKIVMEKEFSIGSDDLARGDYIFGSICDIATDSDGNIYVADNGMFRVQKFRSDGEFVLSIGKGNGLGPGEFVRMTKISIDAEDNLYVSDLQQRRITVFNPNGAVVNTIKVKMMPFQSVVGANGAIFTTGFPPSFSGPLIHKYDQSGSLVGSFCRRDGIHELTFRSGDAGRLAMDRDGNILYTIVYPYEIRKFSPDGELLGVIKRTPSFYDPPTSEHLEMFRTPVVKMRSGSKGLVVLPNNQVFHVIYELKGEKLVFYGDLFSSDGRWLLTVPLTEVNIHSYRIMWADRHGNFYFDESAIFPKVTKYSFGIVDVI